MHLRWKDFNWTGWSNFDYQYQAGSGCRGLHFCQLKLWTILNLHLYELQELIDGKTGNLIKKILKRLEARPGLLQNLTKSYWDFIIQVFNSLWKFYCPNLKNLYWNTFLPTLRTMKENKIWMVRNWITIKSAFLFPIPPWQNDILSLPPSLVSGEKQSLMCEEVASRINAINDRSLVEMIYCFISYCSVCSVFLHFFHRQEVL